MNYSRAEQETSIVWDEEEKVANIYTASPVTMRKLDKLCEQYAEYRRTAQEIDKSGRQTAARYEVPAKLIRFGKPIARIMTDEQREAARERMARMRAERK